MKNEKGGVCIISKKRIRSIVHMVEMHREDLKSLSRSARDPDEKLLLTRALSFMDAIIVDLSLVETGKLR